MATYRSSRHSLVEGGSSPRICPVVLISSTVEMTDGAGAPYDSHTNGENVSPMAVTSASYFLRLTSSRCRAACKGFDWALEQGCTIDAPMYIARESVARVMSVHLLLVRTN